MKNQFPRVNRCLSRQGGGGESAYRVYGLTREGAHSFSPRHRLANRPLEGLRPSWRADNVEHGLARLRSNNPQMASPPHRLGAPDRVAPFMFQRAQPSETAMERMAQRVVGLIVTMGQMVWR